MKITVKAFIDGQEVLSKVFDEGVYRVGRSEFSDIVLQNPAVSRSHLEIRVTEAAVYLTNMSSSGKVKVNNNAVETAEIGDGDEIRLGPFQIVIFHGEREAAAPADGAALEPPPEGGEAPAQNLFGGNEFGMAGNQLAGEGMGDNLPAPVEGGGLPSEGEMDPFGGAGAALALADEPAPAPDLEMEPAAEGTAMGHAETQLEIKPIVAKLMFTEGPRAGDELFIETFEVTLGRSKKADIYLDDEKLSRIHAKITRVGMGFRLVDMNSRNGTYVNGMRILEHPLSSFDEIQIGNSKIKFLIHDVMANEMQRAGQLALVDDGTAGGQVAFDQTKSLAVDALPEEVLLELQRPRDEAAPAPYPAVDMAEPDLGAYPTAPKSKRNVVLLTIIVVLGLVYLMLPSGPPSDQKQTTAQGDTSKLDDPLANVQLPPNIPKEYAELSPDQQRKVEGYYNAAVQAAQQGQYESAVEYLQRIHQLLPFYKNSEELRSQYVKIVREKQIAEAQRRQKDEEKQDLALYLEEGLDYLRAGDFDRAAEAFNSAIVIDPNNPTAIRGLKAAEAKVKSLDEIPLERDEEQEKRKIVSELFQRAVAAFTNKAYQEAIDTAEKIRKIELRGDTQYLNEAKQIIDRARMLQKEEFEPFLIQAKEKYAEGDYNAARDLCEEMLKRDPAYDEAIDLLNRAKKQLNRLAKEAYTYGYILESMNRIEEAKQYWNRARNYVRQGDEYYAKILKKLDNYQ